MKTFKIQAAQGDLLLIRIGAPDDVGIPADAQPVAPDADGRHIVAHSETGHHHYFDAEGVHVYRVNDPMVCYLRLESDADLQHGRPFDTHETISVSAGFYELRRQKEWVADAWRRIED